MKILAIESSCDETAAAVVEDGRNVISSVVASQVEEHRLYGGVVPEIASRRHAEAIVPVVKQALDEANLTLDDIDAIGVTYAPGLIGALLVGVNFAKGLALSTGLPLIPTHHLRSHIASNYISNKELKPPFLCLVVSGGHSHIVMVEDYTKMNIVGKTRDDAAGEAFDKAARTMGMPYPGGIELDKVAENGNPLAFKLPRPVVHDAPYDFSFSGLKTAVINLIHNASQKGEELNNLLENALKEKLNEYRNVFYNDICNMLKLHKKIVPNSKIVMGEGLTYCCSPKLTFERDSETFWTLVNEQMALLKEKGIWGSVIVTTHAPGRSSAWHGCIKQYIEANKLFLED